MNESVAKRYRCRRASLAPPMGFFVSTHHVFPTRLVSDEKPAAHSSQEMSIRESPTTTASGEGRTQKRESTLLAIKPNQYDNAVLIG